MNYQNMKLYNEIKAAMLPVVEAEENAKAWNLEARNLMGDVKTLIFAAKKLNKGTEINPAELIKVIREEIAEDMKPTEETDPDAYLTRETSPETPDSSAE